MILFFPPGGANIAVIFQRGGGVNFTGRKGFVPARSLPDFRRLFPLRPHVRPLAAEKDRGDLGDIEGGETVLRRGEGIGHEVAGGLRSVKKAK